MTREEIQRRVAVIRQELAEASDGRFPAPRLIAVTKTHSPEEILPLAEAGITEIGENRVQELLAKGAGSITSNVKSDKLPVSVKCGEEIIETGRKKIGAMLGDRVEVGCNSVLNPGTVIGRDSNVYPTSCVRGTIPEKCIWKDNGTIDKKK